MEFKLPTVHDIAFEIDGRRFDGSWYVILGEMVVNYNGHTSRTGARDLDADNVALEMFHDGCNR